MNIIIIGAGSIGSLFGAKIALTGQSVYAFVSNRLIESLKHDGLILNELDGSTHKISNYYPLSQSDNIDIDLNSTICIIAVKTIHLENVCVQYKRIIEKIPIVALLQNGIGNEEIIAKYYPNIPILRIITSNGALISLNGQVTHTGKGATFVGPSYNQNFLQLEIATEFCNKLSEAGFNSVFSNDIHQKIWWKAFINIGINVFGALTRLKNGELIKIPSLKKMMMLTLKEAYHVACNLIPNLEPVENYIDQLYEVVKKTAVNKNSMLQDILKGSKTEIQFLNGFIVRKGIELNIATPLNCLLTALIEGIEMNLT